MWGRRCGCGGGVRSKCVCRYWGRCGEGTADAGVADKGCLLLDCWGAREGEAWEFHVYRTVVGADGVLEIGI